MIELVVGGIVLFVVLAVVGVLIGTLSFVFWIVTLPFRLIGFLFKALAAAVVLPLILVPVAIVATVVLGIGLFAALLPALPLILLAALVWWLVARGRRPAPTT